MAHRLATVRIGCHPWQADTNPVLSTNSVLIAPAVKGGQRFSLFWRAGNLRPHDCVRLDGCPEKKKPRKSFGGGGSWREHSIRYPETDFDLVLLVTTPKTSQGLCSVSAYPDASPDSNRIFHHRGDVVNTYHGKSPSLVKKIPAGSRE